MVDILQLRAISNQYILAINFEISSLLDYSTLQFLLQTAWQMCGIVKLPQISYINNITNQIRAFHHPVRSQVLCSTEPQA